MKAVGIARLLPWVFQRTLAAAADGSPAQDGDDSGESPLAAALRVMERFHEPCEAVLAELDRYFDPRRAPPELVAFLARWVDLDRLCASNTGDAAPLDGGASIAPELGRLRELVALAPRLAQRRGTRAGLVQMLEVATGVAGFHIEDGRDDKGRVIPFHVRIMVPGAAAARAALIRRIVEQEKPAYVTAEFQFEAD